MALNVVLLFLYLMMLAGAFCFPQSKKLAYLLLFYFCFLFAFGHYQGDYYIYLWIYTEFDSGLFYREFEPLFTLTFWIATKLGLSFTCYRLIIGFFICSAMLKIIGRQTSCISLAFALYGLFPFFMYTAVMRSGVASIFVLFAIEQLALTRPNKLKFVMLVLIGTLFHYSSCLFLLLLLFDREEGSMSFFIVFSIGLLLTFLLNYTSIPYKFVSLFTSRQKTLQWFRKSDAAANVKGIIGIMSILISMYVMATYNLRIQNYYSLDDDSVTVCSIERPLIDSYGLVDKEVIDHYLPANNMVNVVYKLSMLMFLLFPLMVLASPFTRLPFMVFVLLIITTINTGERGQLSVQQEVRPGVVSLSWIVILGVTLLWKVFFDWPYLREGTSFFWEYLDVSFI